MFRMTDGKIDSQFIDDTLEELRDTFEESVIIKAFVTVGVSNAADGLSKPATYNLIPTSAVIDDIGIEKVNQSGGVLAVGDLEFQIRTVRPHEPTVSPYHPGDRIIYENIEYRLVQKPRTMFLANVVYYEVIGRRMTD